MDKTVISLSTKSRSYHNIFAKTTSIMATCGNTSNSIYPGLLVKLLHGSFNDNKRNVALHYDSSGQGISSDVFSPASSSTPPLMIEGDRFYIDPDGISRTLYKFYDSGQESKFTLEEIWNLEECKKTFVLRRRTLDNENDTSNGNDSPTSNVLDENEMGVLNMGRSLCSIDIDEMDHEYESAGTGYTTWESSIVMALYFASNPQILHNRKVLELGCGIGFGGILTNIVVNKYGGGRSKAATATTNSSQMIKSLTLSDGNPHILRQCLKNVQNADVDCDTYSIKVLKLDWNDYESFSFNEEECFDVIIASDCIYLYRDIEPLANTIAKLLFRARKNANSPSPCVHLFTPYHRAAVRELVEELKKIPGMNVFISTLEMDRARLEPKKKHTFDERLDSVHGNDEFAYASMCTEKFLHIEALYRG